MRPAITASLLKKVGWPRSLGGRGSWYSTSVRTKEPSAKFSVVGYNDVGSKSFMAAARIAAQAPDGQSDAIGYEEPFLIRATMRDRIGHALKGAPDFRTGHPWIDHARYSADMVFESALYRCAPLSSLCAISWL